MERKIYIWRSGDLEWVATCAPEHRYRISQGPFWLLERTVDATPAAPWLLRVLRGEWLTPEPGCVLEINLDAKPGEEWLVLWEYDEEPLFPGTGITVATSGTETDCAGGTFRYTVEVEDART